MIWSSQAEPGFTSKTAFTAHLLPKDERSVRSQGRVADVAPGRHDSPSLGRLAEDASRRTSLDAGAICALQLESLACFFGRGEIVPQFAHHAGEFGDLLGIGFRERLGFGAIDLIQDRDGAHWFLEINPNGQWAWIETRTGQPIATAIVDWLEWKARGEHS